jgi:hypothetical protein
MPLRRGTVDPEDEGGLAWYTVHESDDEREAADAVIDDFVIEVLDRAAVVADAENVQLAELLDGTSQRLQDEVVKFLRTQPAWPEDA